MGEAEAIHHNWKNKISNPAQLGGIETSVLDNGLGRGSRIAWINTGTGLRFKLVLDRAMDIADAFYNQHSLAWLSHAGITQAESYSLKGIDWLKTFGGGLLTTCGLSHVGGPESDKFGERGLHGRINNIPAEIEAIIQPDPFAGKMDMSISAKMKESQVFGPSLELKRSISATLGKASIRIHDVVTNRANTPAPHMLLYHMNLGWPLVDVGADIVWKGKWNARESDDSKIFTDGNEFQKCPTPMESHNGGGEEAAFIDIDSDPLGNCICGIHNAQLGLALSIRFQKSQLPWLTNWQHWGKGEYVTGLEPGTHPPIGQAKAREMQSLLELAPGESRHYDLEIEVFDNEKSIHNFLQHNN